jgi:hypothetical protein
VATDADKAYDDVTLYDDDTAYEDVVAKEDDTAFEAVPNNDPDNDVAVNDPVMIALPTIVKPVPISK